MNAAWTDVEACTLPAADRPRRLDAFDRLFAEGLCEVRREGGTRATLSFQSAPEIAVRVRDLVAAESGCCSFFGFAVTDDGRQVTVEVTVPAAHATTLAAIVDRAEAVLGVAT